MLSVMLCFSQRDLDLHVLIPSNNFQSDLIAGLEREQRVDVGMGFIQSDIADLRDDISLL